VVHRPDSAEDWRLHLVLRDELLSMLTDGIAAGLS
jgi:hypothetical protein